ncbi:hypothetical protein [Pseudomonas nitroreducens]|uniref:hypothetical protein n=1 Tax=Pseudomonas nitroreducens TaxID=46680 RepID=UPI000A940B9C
MSAEKEKNKVAVFSAGSLIGALGGLIGLGGAEFRLPLLIGLFGFGALEAVILNKAMSLIVVATALPFRAMSVPYADVLERWDIIVTLLAGSLQELGMGRDGQPNSRARLFTECWQCYW